MRHRLRYLLALALAASSVRAQTPCDDPPAPEQGFPLVVQKNLAHTYSDGYTVLFDLRAPAIAAPACGWPLVVVVHGSGGSKEVVAGEARRVAERGYATLAYDVRGQGSSLALNDASVFGSTLLGLRELLDLFEMMEAAEALAPALIDFARIGVTGFSQGGSHAWDAAAHSERVPPANPWRSAPFPRVACAVVRASGSGGGRSATALSHRFVEKLFGPSPDKHYAPLEEQAAKSLILADDLEGFADFVYDPALDVRLLLPESQVPVYAHLAYDDPRVSPSAGLKTWSALPAGVPKRLHFGSDNHGAPDNTADSALFEATRLAWLDRFLKLVRNGVDAEAPVYAAVTPDDPAVLFDPQSLWDFRTASAVPAPEAQAELLYLGAGLLSAAPPVAPGADAIVHAVPPGFDIAAYTQLVPTPAQLHSLVPLASASYDGAPLALDRHVAGAARVHLFVESASTRFQLHAVLQDVAPNGSTRFVCDGAVAVRDDLAPGANELELALYVQSYVFRAGHRVRLALENLTVHRPLGVGATIKLVPSFESSSVAIRRGGATPSSLELPLLAFGAPTLNSHPLRTSVQAPQNERLALHSSSALAGSPYLVLAGLSGTAPGVVVAGTLVQLNPDALTQLVLAAPNATPFVGFLGLLDAAGRAPAGLALDAIELPSALVGVELDFAAVVVTPDGALLATNARSLAFGS